MWTSAGLRQEASSRKSRHRVERDVRRCKGNDLVYAGKVYHGLDKKSAAYLRERLIRVKTGNTLIKQKISALTPSRARMSKA